MNSLRTLSTAVFIFCSMLFINPVFAAEYWLLLDSSASLNESQAALRNESGRGYAKMLLGLDSGSTVGVIDFSEGIRGILEPTGDMNTVRHFINNIGRSGSLTDMEAALKYFLAPSKNIRKLYLFTDGQVDVRPGRCVGCPPTSEDTASINRIRNEVVPDLLKQTNPPVINAVGLGDQVDMKFLEDISFQSGGGAKHISNMHELLLTLAGLWQDRDMRGPGIPLRGDTFTVDGGATRSFGVIGPPDTRIIPPAGTGMLKHCSTYFSGLKQRMHMIQAPRSGDYVVQTARPDLVNIYSNIDMVISDISPKGRSYFYQYEVIPFKITLAAKDGNESIAEKLAQKFIEVTVIMSGDCMGSLGLPFTQDQNRKYFYEGKWWLDCRPARFPAKAEYAFHVKDDSQFDTVFPRRDRIPMQVVKTSFDWDIPASTPDSLSNFQKQEGEYFVSEKIKPDLVFQLPAGIVSVLSKKYCLGEKETHADDSYTIKPDDINNNNLFAYLRCKTDRDKEVEFKFRKKLKILFPPFDIKQGSMGSYISGLPQGFKAPFTNLRGLPKKIDIPFTCNVNLDQVQIMARLTTRDFEVQDKVFPVSLKREDAGFRLYIETSKKLSPGDYQFQVTIDAERYLINPIKYDFQFKVYPWWLFMPAFILAMIVILALAAYIVVLILYMAKGDEKCTKISETTKNWGFPLRFFPPGRWEIEKNNKDEKVCRIGRRMFSNGFFVKSYKEKPVVTSGPGCKKKSDSVIKITKMDYYQFTATIQAYNITIQKEI